MTVVSFRNDDRISDAERAALRDYCTDLGGNIVDLARRLGLKVFEEELPDDQSGFIEYDEFCGSESGYKIVLNRTHSVARKQFTAAHEIGHYVLHKDTPAFRQKRNNSADIFQFPSGYRSQDMWDYGDYPRWMEREADAFAATILLPANALRRAPEFINGEPIALAKRLCLSPAFVLRRFEEIEFAS